MSKKRVYIALFVVLGILLGFLAHQLLEIWYTNMLLQDYAKYSLGYTWADWFTIHKYFAIVLFVLSLVFGYFQGKFWWRLVYEEGRFDPFFRRLRKFLALKPYRK